MEHFDSLHRGPTLNCSFDIDCPEYVGTGERHMDQSRCVSGWCECPFAVAKIGEGCDVLTPDSAWAASSRVSSLLVWLWPTAAALRQLHRAVRVRVRSARGCACTMAMSVSLLTLLSCVGIVGYLSMAVVTTTGISSAAPYPYYLFNKGLQFLGINCIILATLNLSLMWIEISLCSEKLEAVAPNLRRTRKFIIAVFCCYFFGVPTACSVLPDDENYVDACSSIWIGMSGAVLVLIICSYSYASARLRRLNERRSKPRDVDSPSSQPTDAQGDSMLQHIEKTSRRVAGALSVNCVGGLCSTISWRVKVLSVLWLSQSVVFVTGAAALGAICDFVSFTIGEAERRRSADPTVPISLRRATSSRPDRSTTCRSRNPTLAAAPSSENMAMTMANPEKTPSDSSMCRQALSLGRRVRVASAGASLSNVRESEERVSLREDSQVELCPDDAEASITSASMSSVYESSGTIVSARI